VPTGPGWGLRIFVLVEFLDGIIVSVTICQQNPLSRCTSISPFLSNPALYICLEPRIWSCSLLAKDMRSIKRNRRTKTLKAIESIRKDDLKWLDTYSRIGRLQPKFRHFIYLYVATSPSGAHQRFKQGSTEYLSYSIYILQIWLKCTCHANMHER
jgi:hypothetical protein